MVFGEGLVKAAELEAKDAIYPRIIVDDSITNLAVCARLIETKRSTTSRRSSIYSYGSIRIFKPKYVEEILNESKKYEYRKRIAKKPVERILIYATHPMKEIVGEVQVTEVIRDSPEALWKQTKELSGIDEEAISAGDCVCSGWRPLLRFCALTRKPFLSISAATLSATLTNSAS